MSTQLEALQTTFDELGTPLRDVTFVVVDLETTGGSHKDCAITEIGAVKVRGGEQLGEFQTLVNPGSAIPPFIAVLTGITDSMVAGAPSVGSAVASFLEFARGSVLVAHNAPFDLGFLRAACEQTGQRWPGFEHIDTARIAARALTKDEVPNCKLSTLARHFKASTTPVHRALDDARATVDVLHGLIARVGNLGVHSLEELRTYTSLVSPAQRRKRFLAEGLPHAPGVYLFRDGKGRALYIGKSNDLRTRVRSYFTASESRKRMGEMVAAAERVDHVPCQTGLEAEVRELRLIAEHSPRYNRRSRWPDRALWLTLTDEAFPRLSIVRRQPGAGVTALGPFGSKGSAEVVQAALHEALPLRQCTKKLSARRRTPSCVLAEIGRCGAPCEGGESVEAYARHVTLAAEAMQADPEVVVAALHQRIDRLVETERFEDAAAIRDRLAGFLRAAAASQRLTRLTSIDELVAARPSRSGGWEIHVVRRGRLVAAGLVPRGAAPMPYVEALVATAESVPAGLPAAATAEESRCVLRWLTSDGVRLVRSSEPWTSPARGAARLGDWVESVTQARVESQPFRDRRGLRPVHQPVRP